MHLEGVGIDHQTSFGAATGLQGYTKDFYKVVKSLAHFKRKSHNAMDIDARSLSKEQIK